MTWYKKKKLTIPLAIIVFFVALRIVLEPVLLGQINKKLSNLSPELEGHADGLHIAIIRGAFGVRDVTMKLKKAKHNFLELEKADVSLAWREIIKGNLMADAMVDGVKFVFDERIPGAFKRAFPEKPDEPKKKPPIRISRVDWRNVSVVYPSSKAYTNEGPFRLNNIEGRITNLFGDTKNPRSFFHVSGTGSGSANFKAIGSANLLADPVEWDVDAQMLGFKLVSMNRFLYNKVPLTFRKGQFDLYAEAKSEEGRIRGYVKPFMEDVAFIKTDEKFKGPKQWFIEVAGAVGDWLLQAKRDKTVATKVPFRYDGKKFSIDTSKAVGNVIEHGFDQEISPGVDADLHMQAQEARKEAKETVHENKEKEEAKK